MPIRYKNLNQLVYERLRREILDGKLRPGARLKQEELTRLLGVSRTPVREALQRLETEGLIQFLRRSTVLVTSIPKARVEEIFELRSLLEGYAAEKAADHLDEKSLTKLHHLVEEMSSYYSRKQVDKLLQRNDEFHRMICSLSGNETLLGMLEQIWRDIRRLRFDYLLTKAGHEQSTREHRTLLEALESRDKRLISEIVHKHALRTMQGILQTMPKDSVPEDGTRLKLPIKLSQAGTR
jgi:DNA-binding GntR family transcriptional regulator